MEITVSIPLAFLGGLASFLSACVLTVVPGYLVVVLASALKREEVVALPWRSALGDAVPFLIGFGIIFLTLGLSSTSVGVSINRSLPLLSRIGGLWVIALGIPLLGIRERFAPRVRVSGDKPNPSAWRKLGRQTAVGLTGVIFGAGWTPCIGPVLASILLFTSLDATVVGGFGRLFVYGVGLTLPFLGLGLVAHRLVSRVWINGELSSARKGRWARVVAGTVMVLLGVSMLTGHYSSITASLADLGQLVDLEVS